MKSLVSKYKLEVAGLMMGAVAGWCYWYFVGCASGTCLISSRPLNAMIYGGTMGALLLSMFKKDNSTNSKKR
jgi:hypothetical protein